MSYFFLKDRIRHNYDLDWLLHTGNNNADEWKYNMLFFFSFFYHQNLCMGRVRVSRRWLKCTRTGAVVFFLWKLCLSALFPDLYNFLDAHTIFVVICLTYALHVDTSPVYHATHETSAALLPKKYLHSVYFRKRVDTLSCHPCNLCGMSKDSSCCYPTGVCC